MEEKVKILERRVKKLEDELRALKLEHHREIIAIRERHIKVGARLVNLMYGLESK